MNELEHHHHLTTQSPSVSGAGFFDQVADTFSQMDFMPHGHCYLWKPALVSTHVISDALIGIAYVAIAITLYVLVKRIKIQFSTVVLSFGLFIGACGMTHFMEIWNLWNADYWTSAWVKVVTAIASVATGIYLFRLRHPLVMVAEAAKLSEQRRLDLEVLTKDLEERVMERTREIEHKNDLLNKAIAARDDFLSIASHELKTPLTSLKIQAQLQKRMIGKGIPEAYSKEKIDQNADKLEKLVLRLDRLVDDMLDISRIRTGKLTIHKVEADLCQVVKDVVERMQNEFIATTGTKINFDGQANTIGMFDTLRIEQVVTNLLQNALKYGNGKKVTVTVSSSNDMLLISVQDEGIGISKQDQNKIFDRFERAVSANEVSGLGLGLFISKQIIGAHQGRIWVESDLNQGSAFYVELPK